MKTKKKKKKLLKGKKSTFAQWPVTACAVRGIRALRVSINRVFIYIAKKLRKVN